MVSLTAVKSHNATLESLGPGLIAVFVGGTSGISLSTALAFARHTISPKIFLIGRSQSAADAAIASLKSINPSAQPNFLQTDLSLLENVDKVCAKITAREKKLNLLFMTPGYMTLSGREETAEGLDRKLVLHYYARMRFITKMLALLSAAAKDASVEPSARLSRVISVLDPLVAVRPGGSSTLDYSDLSLKHNFSLGRCGAHASLMGNFFLESLARQYVHTSFIHAYPSGVATSLMRDMPGGSLISGILKTLARPFIVPIEESGERHLYAATSERFPSRIEGMNEGRDIAVGSDGTRGSGSYWLNWNGEAFPRNSKLDKVREECAGDRVVHHTEEVFQRVCEEGKIYP
ncbi:hypothetical protein N7492_004579 [Penicillium capsulatum]|uniref:Short-chain dehydrogenase/reductase n=1 Tax=Penicillium capsulatum TaxID=69766 RepID=A0A9W9LQW0_9EURO|nr:hypothetical protein N7492_004579 [Penicillium capsulatum]KAJ6136304.1 hypothetical protein N7512_001464 [Penicillium capsulatum]